MITDTADFFIVMAINKRMRKLVIDAMQQLWSCFK